MARSADRRLPESSALEQDERVKVNCPTLNLSSTLKVRVLKKQGIHLVSDAIAEVMAYVAYAL